MYAINMACNFEVTYLHYVEQKKKASYRYFKNFKGEIIDNGKRKFVQTRFFVGKKEINYSMDLSELKRQLKKVNKFYEAKFGRFFSTSVNCYDFFKYSEKLLEKDEYSLIKERKKYNPVI